MKNPHDKFFKETLTRRENALSFFRKYLPADIAAKLDWRTLRITKETFTEPELRERFSDILCEIRAKGRQVFIYLLPEHQSTVDLWMPLRLLGYIVRIWELYRKQNPEADKLPGIVPMVFYHGREKWEVSVHFTRCSSFLWAVQKGVPKFHLYWQKHDKKLPFPKVNK